MIVFLSFYRLTQKEKDQVKISNINFERYCVVAFDAENKTDMDLSVELRILVTTSLQNPDGGSGSSLLGKKNFSISLAPKGKNHFTEQVSCFGNGLVLGQVADVIVTGIQKKN